MYWIIYMALYTGNSLEEMQQEDVRPLRKDLVNEENELQHQSCDRDRGTGRGAFHEEITKSQDQGQAQV